MWRQELFMTRSQIREYDRIAIEEFGIPGPVLMENAGAGAARVAAKMAAGVGPIAIVAGPGNNGGDGFVIARHLRNRGLVAHTYLAVPRGLVQGDALLNLRILEVMNADIIDVSDPSGPERLTAGLAAAGLVVDALLGTGVTRDVEGHLGAIIEAINEAQQPVLSIDIPSGLDADSGRPWKTAVRATATVTFGHVKRGLLLYPGAELAGRLHVVPLGVPDEVSARAGYDGKMLTEAEVRTYLPVRTADSHKGTFGHLLVVAGSLGKTGAAAMVGRAAMRSGTGLVTIATAADAQLAVEAKCLEVMVDSILERADGPLTAAAQQRVVELLVGKAAVVVGPGTGTAPGMSALVMHLLQILKVPAVVDADGITILARDPAGARRVAAPLVCTPHPGEMATLINRSTTAIQADRVGAAREAAQQHKVVLVLKGAHTVVAAPDGHVFINSTGNPGMGCGGMGDVLAGIIGGFLAQGVPPLEAALLGVYAHGAAGDAAAQQVGQCSLIASDVIDALPNIFSKWQAQSA